MSVYVVRFPIPVEVEPISLVVVLDNVPKTVGRIDAD